MIDPTRNAIRGDQAPGAGATIWRRDSFRLTDADVARATRTPQGFLRIEGAVIAREGVLEYSRADGGVWRELRDAAVMHRADALKRYNGAPLLHYDHPRDAAGNNVSVSPDLAHSFIGSISGTPYASTARDDQLGEIPVTRADVVITSPRAIEAVQSGDTRQFSVGYRTDLDRTPGTWRGQSYDARQTTDVGDHLVLCRSARAGAVTAFRVDSAGVPVAGGPPAPSDPPQPPNPKPPRPKMPTMNIGGVTVEVTAESVPLVQQLQQRADTAEARVKELEANLKTKGDALTEAEGKVKTLEAEADQLKGDASRVHELAIERGEILKKAEPHLPKGFDVAKATNADIKRAVVVKLHGDTFGNDTPDAVIDGVWKTIKADANGSSNDGATHPHGSPFNPPPLDDPPSDNGGGRGDSSNKSGVEIWRGRHGGGLASMK